MEQHLTDSYRISPIIKGGWQLAEGHSEAKSATPVEDTFEFVDAGVTTFDCADHYTGVEELIGEFREQYRQRRGDDPPVQVHTKFVPDRKRLDEVSREYVERIIDRSRRRLGVDSLDLVQFHWWDYSVDNYVETAQYLAELREEGKIDHIGVTNFDVEHLEEIMDAGVPVISNQVQYSLLDHRPESGMVDFCAERDVSLLCYGTLAGGFLTERYLGEPDPGPATSLDNRSLTKYRLIVRDTGGWDAYQNLLETVAEVADKHGVSIPNVASRYVLDRPEVEAVIIGARDTSHLEDNLRTLEFELDADDERAIREARADMPALPGGIYSVERDMDSDHAEIMHYNRNEQA